MCKYLQEPNNPLRFFTAWTIRNALYEYDWDSYPEPGHTSDQTYPELTEDEQRIVIEWMEETDPVLLLEIKKPVDGMKFLEDDRLRIIRAVERIQEMTELYYDRRFVYLSFYCKLDNLDYSGKAGEEPVDPELDEDWDLHLEESRSPSIFDWIVESLRESLEETVAEKAAELGFRVGLSYMGKNGGHLVLSELYPYKIVFQDETDLWVSLSSLSAGTVENLASLIECIKANVDVRKTAAASIVNSIRSSWESSLSQDESAYSWLIDQGGLCEIDRAHEEYKTETWESLIQAGRVSRVQIIGEHAIDYYEAKGDDPEIPESNVIPFAEALAQQIWNREQFQQELNDLRQGQFLDEPVLIRLLQAALNMRLSENPEIQLASQEIVRLVEQRIGPKYSQLKTLIAQFSKVR